MTLETQIGLGKEIKLKKCDFWKGCNTFFAYCIYTTKTLQNPIITFGGHYEGSKLKKLLKNYQEINRLIQKKILSKSNQQSQNTY